MNKLLLITGLIFSNLSFSCLYFKRDIDPKQFTEKEREALMFHDGKLANMIVKTSFEGKLPPELNWVLPLPSKPVSYEETNPEIFSELSNFFKSNVDGSGGLVGGVVSKSFMPRAPGIKVHETVKLEGYKIIPIEILSTESGKELNTFLGQKGFNQMPDVIQKPYLKKGAFFLAIQILPKSDTADKKMITKPLWIKYNSNELRFPLKFTHDYRTFDFTLYILSFEGVYNSFSSELTQKSPWMGMGFDTTTNSSLKTLYPKTEKLSQTVLASFLKNKNTFKKLYANLDPSYLSQKKAQGKPPAFDEWAKNLSIYRFPINGINITYKTKDFKEDPGMTLPF